MTLLKQGLFQTTYKIVPTYTRDNKCNGYVPKKKTIIGWMPFQMYQFDEEGNMQEVEAYFKTYQDALTFVKHETTILSDEEISNAKNG